MELKDVDVLRVQPGDIIVVRLTRALSATQRDQVRNELKTVLPDNETILFDGDDVKLSIVRPA